MNVQGRVCYLTVGMKRLDIEELLSGLVYGEEIVERSGHESAGGAQSEHDPRPRAHTAFSRV